MITKNAKLTAVVFAVATVTASVPSVALATGLTVSLSGGGSALSNVRARDWYFPAIRPTVSGGSGVYNYTWTTTRQDPIYTWFDCGPSESCTPHARASHNCDTSEAWYQVTVFDAITGQSATSNPTIYQFSYLVPGDCA